MWREISGNQLALVTASGVAITANVNFGGGYFQDSCIFKERGSEQTGFYDISILPQTWQTAEAEQILPTTHAFEFVFDGQSIYFDYATPGDPESGTVMTPEITKEYQP